MSLCRQNYPESSESAVNAQINHLLSTAYIYQSFSQYFDRDENSLPGFVKYFKEKSENTTKSAEKFMKYQADRGAKVNLSQISQPPEKPKSILDSLEFLMTVEKIVNSQFIEMHELASSTQDAHLVDFIEEDYLPKKVDNLRQIANLVVNLKRMGTEGLGLYMFDQTLISQEKSF
eukprot:TRINITY_DN3900_c0_g1_i1.p1 TRINITY_DN3900_c0_g1~~TRINITY_DN3900_c0_g1_i1.p1  ORF type:complete len:175 (-),score=74.97 TRINITY_DN3900_c0_g1_i1:53-577(-)